MARARNIKPSIFKNEILGVADPLYTLLFEGLWVLADREGRLENRPLRIKAEVFPYRDGIDMPAMLDWLEHQGFIVQYEVEGKHYILILSFTKHQSPHKNEAPSDIPACPGIDSEEIGTAFEKIGTTRADSLLLTPSSLIAVCGEPKAHTQLKNEYREVIVKARPELDAETVFQGYRQHYPPDKQNPDKWRKWVIAERSPKVAIPPSTADPDSRASIEALGLSRGLGKWDEMREPWVAYRKRVKEPTNA